MRFNKKTCSNLIYFLVATFPFLVMFANVLSQVGVTELSDSYINFNSNFLSSYRGFFSSDVFSWYDTLFISIGLSSSSLASVRFSYMCLIYYYPLYIFIVTCVRLVVEIIVFIPNACRNWINKLGGGSNE